MVEPFVINGERYVACATRLGSIKRTGPVTNKQYIITFNGVWIDNEDAEELVGVEEDVWCFRQKGYIRIVTVFNMDPSEVEIRNKQSS